MIPSAPLHTFASPLDRPWLVYSSILTALLFAASIIFDVVSTLMLGNMWLIAFACSLGITLVSMSLEDKQDQQRRQRFENALITVPLPTLIVASTSAELDSPTKEQIRLYLNKHHQGWSFAFNSQELTHYA